jgi:hypothetical protein
MTPQPLIVRFPRSASAVAFPFFVVALLLWLDYGFLHTLTYSTPPALRRNPWFFLVLPPILVSCLVTAKTLLNPSTVFAADHQGVQLGRGVFFNHLLPIPWSKVQNISTGPFGTRTDTPADQALKLTFTPDVTLPVVGFAHARKASDHTWEIRHSLFPQPLAQTVAHLTSLQSVPRHKV